MAPVLASSFAALCSSALAASSCTSLTLVQRQASHTIARQENPFEAATSQKEDVENNLAAMKVGDSALVPAMFLHGEMIGNMANATLTQSNLGGLGPDTGVEKIIFKNAGIIGSTYIDLHIENMTEYDGSDTSQNGRGGDLANPYGFVNLQCDMETVFKYSFYVDSAPVTLGRFFFTFHDLDSGNEGVVKEFIGSKGFTEAYLSNTTELELYTNASFDGTVWISSTPGNGADNPTDPMHLTPQQRDRSVTLEFVNSSFVLAEYGLTAKTGCIGRNLMFGFKTNLVPTECETCVEGNDGQLTCCAAGGSWFGLCGSSSQVERGVRYYQYSYGKEVCVTPAPTPSPTELGETCGTCVIWGDPHIITFQEHQQRLAEHPRREAFFRTRGWKSDQVTVSETGKFWLVKSDNIAIQGAYTQNQSTGTTSLTQLAVSGAFLGGRVLIIQPTSGTSTWDGQDILPSLPSQFADELIQAKYHNAAKMVKDGTNGPGIDVALPLGVTLTVNRWKYSLAAEINMCPTRGQIGQCGDFSDTLY